MTVMNAFAIASMPFVLAEAATRVVSFLIRQLSVPLLVRAGTAVDLTLLITGLAIMIFRMLKTAATNLDAPGRFGAPDRRRSEHYLA